MNHNNHIWLNIIMILTTLSLLITGCQPAFPGNSPTIEPTRIKPTTATTPSTMTVTFIPDSTVKLNKGEFYFSINDRQSFMFSRNLAGYETVQYEQLLDLTRSGGGKFVRIQLDSFGMGYSNTGELDETWARKWDNVFKTAALNNIYIMLTFSAWYDWNNGDGYSTWGSNPLNEINGGPAATPAELFTTGSPTQQLWLHWMETLIQRWQGLDHIIAWEIFSEVNMVPDITQTKAIDFINASTVIIRNHDSFHRPITASLADFGNWSSFYQNDSLDFINIHPYPVSGKLDSTIITEVHSMLTKYHKPVMIGECGLSFETPDSDPPTLTTADQADIGIKHAIWAAAVSGAMNGRALWWEDGVAIYFPALDFPFIQKYANAELPASNFVEGIDFTGFQPLISLHSSGVWGAAIGNEITVLGWYRDAASEPPDWKVRPILSKQTVTLSISVPNSVWEIDFYDTKTGTDIVSSAIVTSKGNKVTILLPDFADDIAFKMHIQK